MTRNQLIDAPGGTLQISKTGKWVQYYHYIKEENKRKKHIPNHNNKLSQELAHIPYYTRIQKLTEKRLAQINKILKDYDDDEMEKVFLREHKERQKLIKPVEPIWEMKVNQWLEQEYQKKGILFIAAAIGDDKNNIERIYGNSFLDITDLAQIPIKLTSVIKKHLQF